MTATGNEIVDKLNAEGWDLGRNSNQIRRFKSIRAGDVVVVPYWGTLAVGIATGEALYDGNYYGKDGCNQLRVVFPKDAHGKVRLISRSDVSEGLQSRLKIRMTIVSLAEFQPELDSLLAKTQAGESYSWSAEIVTREQGIQAEAKRQLLTNIRSGRTGLKAGGIGLEKLVRDLLIADGFSADILAKTAFPEYSDADIKASKSNKLRDDEFLVQVKHHSGVTGDWGQQQLKQIKQLLPEEFADFHLVLITSGEVDTKEKARAEADKDFPITILDGSDLVDWIFETLALLSTETKTRLGISMIPQILH